MQYTYYQYYANLAYNNIIITTFRGYVMHRAAVVLVIEFTAALGWWWPAAAVAWDTDRLYGTPTRARLTDVVVWRNRAYACWPRADASQPVTLLELPWPETADGQASSSWTPRRPFYADQQVSAAL